MSKVEELEKWDAEGYRSQDQWKARAFGIAMDLDALRTQRAEVAPPKRDPDYYYDFTENKMYGSLKDAKRRGCIEKDLIPLYAFTVTTTSGSV